MKICIECQKTIDDDARFCPYCGKDQISSSFPSAPSAAEAGEEEDEPAPDDAAEEAQAAGARKSRRLKAALLGVTAFFALILIAVGTHSALSGFLKNNNLALTPEQKAREEARENPTETEPAASEEPETTVIGTDVGNTYLFGVYEQTPDTEEAIEWVVLKKEAKKILVISKYALDCKRYNADYTNATWETCSLREWLNVTFCNAAFSAAEQRRILTTDVSAGTNPEYDTYAGNPTADKIFLLSLEEAETLFASDAERICEPTRRARSRGAWVSADGYCWWLLRSPGGASDTVAGVSYTGKTDPYGNSVDYASAGVRPAMWIAPER